ADRRVSRGDAGRMAADRSDAGEAVRSCASPAVPDEGRRRRAVLRDRSRGVRSPAGGARRRSAGRRRLTEDAHPLEPSAPGLSVIKPGMLTTIQDEGRWGLQAHGVPVAGPMDPVSHRLANALVGNDRGAATLEITLVGPELEFDDERIVAVTGAAF